MPWSIEMLLTNTNGVCLVVSGTYPGVWMLVADIFDIWPCSDVICKGTPYKRLLKLQLSYRFKNLQPWYPWDLLSALTCSPFSVVWFIVLVPSHSIASPASFVSLCDVRDICDLDARLTFLSLQYYLSIA